MHDTRRPLAHLNGHVLSRASLVNLSRRLERKGYVVVLAVDGQNGVEMAQSQAPDLVLMDMSLPVLDGWEATRRLKSDAATQHIPVIALTAHAMSSDRAYRTALSPATMVTRRVRLPARPRSSRRPIRSPIWRTRRWRPITA